MIQNGTHPHPPSVPPPPTKQRPFYTNSNFPPSTLPLGSTQSTTQSGSSTNTTTGFHPSSTSSRSSVSAGAPYSIPTSGSRTGLNSGNVGGINGNGGNTGSTNPSSSTNGSGPRMGTWPTANGLRPAGVRITNPGPKEQQRNGATFAHPAQKPLPPVQRGREAVLFSALPETDV